MADQKQSSLLGHSFQELNEVVQNFGQPAYRGRQLFDAIYRQRIPLLEEISTLPQNMREQLKSSGVEVGLPQIEKRFQSIDGTVRYLMLFADGQSVEMVWMPEG